MVTLKLCIVTLFLEVVIMKNNQIEHKLPEFTCSLFERADILKAREGIENLCEKVGFERHNLLKVLSCVSDIQREFLRGLDGVESAAGRIDRKNGTGIFIVISGKIRDGPDAETPDKIYNGLNRNFEKKRNFFEESKLTRGPPLMLTLELTKWRN